MNNRERNTYVRAAITDALLELLRAHELDEITVDALARTAGVGRASFYRNFASKEDVVSCRLRQLLTAWKRSFEASGETDVGVMFASLFEHIRANQDFYLLLHRRGLAHLLLEYIVEDSGPKPGQPSAQAYTHAFFAYGLYGWIEEWLARGMVDGTDQIVAMFAGVRPEDVLPQGR